MSNIKLYHGNCLDVLKTIPDNSFDSIITDPPYGLSKEPDIAEVLKHWLAGDDYKHTSNGFMSKSWDSFVPGPAIWKECYRVLKPGGHALVFAGTRTQDLMGISLRIAGFQIRDCLQYFHDSSQNFDLFWESLDNVQKDAYLKLQEGTGEGRLYWLHGQGFPKSLSISKAIDSKLGLEREVVGQREDILKKQAKDLKEGKRSIVSSLDQGAPERNNGFVNVSADITAPASELAKLWEGWGTQLKPANEPIIVAMKPCEGNFVDNALKWGVSGLNIDGARVGTSKSVPASISKTCGNSLSGSVDGSLRKETGEEGGHNPNVGRFPANVITDGSKEVLEQFPNSISKQGKQRSAIRSNLNSLNNSKEVQVNCEYSDSGSAARFFYCAKASPSERNKGCEDLEEKSDVEMTGRKEGSAGLLRIREDDSIRENPYAGKSAKAKNTHPTLKPVTLMKYLCELTKTPTGGIVLDPFMGSGSTGLACQEIGRDFVGIELEEEYFKIAQARLKISSKEPYIKVNEDKGSAEMPDILYSVEKTRKAFEKHTKLSWSSYDNFKSCQGLWFINYYLKAPPEVQLLPLEKENSRAIPGTIIQKLFEIFVNNRVYLRPEMRTFGNILKWFETNCVALFHLSAFEQGVQHEKEFGFTKDFFTSKKIGVDKLTRIRQEFGLDYCFTDIGVSYLNWDTFNSIYTSKERLFERLFKMFPPILDLFLAQGINLNLTRSELYLQVPVGSFTLSGSLDFVCNIEQKQGLDFQDLSQLTNNYMLLDGKYNLSATVKEEQLRFYAYLLFNKTRKLPGKLGFIEWSKANFKPVEFNLSYGDKLNSTLQEINRASLSINVALNNPTSKNSHFFEDKIVTLTPEKSYCTYCLGVGFCPAAREKGIESFISSESSMNKKQTERDILDSGLKNCPSGEIKL